MSCGPPCGSFVFLNMKTSGRRKDRPFGYASIRSYVRMANVNLDGTYVYFCFTPAQLLDHVGINTWLFSGSKDNNPHDFTVAAGHGEICVCSGRTTCEFTHALVPLPGLLREDHEEDPPSMAACEVAGCLYV